MLLKNLSSEAKKKLSTFRFKENSDINQEICGGNVLWGFYSFTPLMYAAYQGDLPLVRELVENNADLNKRDEFFDYTALMWAAGKGYDKVVAYLLEKGADVTHQANNGGRIEDAYSLSKKNPSCCSFSGFWQRTQKVLGIADMDNTHQIINSYYRKNI